MDEYFRRHDGEAATVEQFLAALGDAAGVDLSRYLRWYAQAGTPQLRARGHYDAAQRRYRLDLQQHTAPTPGQAQKLPLPIPLRLALFDAQGQALPLRRAADEDARSEYVIELLVASASVAWAVTPTVVPFAAFSLTESAVTSISAIAPTSSSSASTTLIVKVCVENEPSVLVARTAISCEAAASRSSSKPFATVMTPEVVSIAKRPPAESSRE